MISMIAAIVELFLFFVFYFCFSFFFYLSDRSDHMETRLNLLPVHENKQTKKKQQKKRCHMPNCILFSIVRLP